MPGTGSYQVPYDLRRWLLRCRDDHSSVCWSRAGHFMGNCWSYHSPCNSYWPWLTWYWQLIGWSPMLTWRTPKEMVHQGRGELRNHPSTERWQGHDWPHWTQRHPRHVSGTAREVSEISGKILLVLGMEFFGAISGHFLGIYGNC